MRSRKARDEACVQQRHVAGEYDELDAERLRASRRSRRRAPRGRDTRRARRRCVATPAAAAAFERGRARLVRPHRHDLGLAAVDVVEQRLQVRARARGEHADAGHAAFERRIGARRSSCSVPVGEQLVHAGEHLLRRQVVERAVARQPVPGVAQHRPSSARRAGSRRTRVRPTPGRAARTTSRIASSSCSGGRTLHPAAGARARRRPARATGRRRRSTAPSAPARRRRRSGAGSPRAGSSSPSTNAQTDAVLAPARARALAAGRARSRPRRAVQRLRPRARARGPSATAPAGPRPPARGGRRSRARARPRRSPAGRRAHVEAAVHRRRTRAARPPARSSSRRRPRRAG